MTGERIKKSQIGTRLTTEGLVFSVILAFVTVSAIMRNVNLLIILAGMMIVALLLSWRSQIHLLANLFVRRTVPSHIHAGQVVNIQWECLNESRYLAAWNTNIHDSVQWLESPGTDVMNMGEKELKRLRKSNRTQVQVVFSEVLASQSMYTSYKTMFANRGRYSVGGASLSTDFPFGLVKSVLKLPGDEEIIVAPKVGTLTAQWDKRLRSMVHGSESVKRKRGVEDDEFYGLRRWRSGDSFRYIDWRTTAKFGYPMVKQFDQQSNRDLGLVLDLYLPDPTNLVQDELGDLDHWGVRCETALSFGATVISQIGKEVQGQLALAVCGEEVDYAVDRYNRELINVVMRSLALARPGSSPSFGPMVETLSNSISAGTPVFVISSRQMPADHGQWGLSEEAWVRLQPLVRWIQVGTSEFESIFIDKLDVELRKVRELAATGAEHVSG